MLAAMKYCLVCGNQFQPQKYHPHQKYCCRKCTSRASHRRRFNLSIRTLDLICLVCNKKFTQKRANNTHFCSRLCKKLASSRALKGLPINGPRKHIKGSGYTTAQGYKILSKKHPNSSKRGQILEHKLVMSEYLGRPLLKHETVHHKNGIRNDNRIENLELWSKSHPFGQRVEDKIKWCKEFLKEYGYEIIKIL